MRKFWDFGPWKIGVDVETTREYYKNFHAKTSVDLKEKLSPKQKAFFESFGIDLSKMKVDSIKWPEDLQTITLRALCCGDLYSIPKDQAELYFDDNDGSFIFSKSDQHRIIISDRGSMLDTEVCGMLISFSHPLLYYAAQTEDENDIDEKYKQWFCGECFVKAIIFNK